MSKTSASSPRKEPSAGRSDAASLPYREWIGAPVRGSRPFSTAAMYWMSPRTPCSGPKRAARRTRGAPWKRSAAWRRRRSTAVGLQMRPTASPRKGAKRFSTSTSRPEATFALRRPRIPIIGKDTTSPRRSCPLPARLRNGPQAACDPERRFSRRSQDDHLSRKRRDSGQRHDVHLVRHQDEVPPFRAFAGEPADPARLLGLPAAIVEERIER